MWEKAPLGLKEWLPHFPLFLCKEILQLLQELMPLTLQVSIAIFYPAPSLYRLYVNILALI